MSLSNELVRRILVEKRLWIVPLVVLALVNVGVYVLGVYPLQVRVQSAERRAEAARAERRAADADARQARAAVDGLSRARQALDRFYGEVLPKSQADARHVTYLELAQIAQRSSLRFERRSSGRERPRGSNLTRVDAIMQLRGSYRELREFIHDVETAEAFIVISDVSVGRSRVATDDALDLAMQVSTYFREDDE